MRAPDESTPSGTPDDLPPVEDATAGHVATAGDVARLVRRQWGDALRGTGVVHGTSVWRRDADTHVSLRLGPSTPTALHDTVALGVARARADAILTTGSNLRAEPDLTHAFPGPSRLSEALAAWRREALDKDRPPVSLVLTSGRGLDLDHPLFSGPGRQIVYTDRDAAYTLESRALDAGIEIVAVDRPTPHGAVDFLRAAFGAATITIEAGPSVARQLYGGDGQPAIIDEVMLSVFDGPSLPTAARGARQTSPSSLRRQFRRPAAPYRVLSEDGPWSFVRYVR